ncbi:MAG: DUF4212 domain-containing protein [Vulcanibacillus sp.]
MTERSQRLKEYWKKNVTLIISLLTVWALVSFVFSILLGDVLSNVKFFGVTLSFWFAQQGSIFTFVILLFIYAWRMDRLDKEYDVEEHKVIDTKEGKS